MQVEAEGFTRVLYIYKVLEESKNTEERQQELIKTKDQFIEHRNLYQQLQEEIDIKERMDADKAQRILNLGAVEEALVNLQAMLDPAGTEELHIRQRHHLLVEIKEAKQLRAADLNGMSDPFVHVSFRANDRQVKRSGITKQHFTTYVIEKTLNPKWQNQIFIFRVSCRDMRADRGG
jgi:hypothetical protein